MIDKGKTIKLLQAVAKIPQLQTFRSRDLPKYSGGTMSRLIKRGIVQRIGNGEYKRLSSSPVKEYYSRGRGYRAEGVVVPVVRKDNSQAVAHNGPSVKIVPYRDTTIIFIGHRIFMGTEVAMVPREFAPKKG